MSAAWMVLVAVAVSIIYGYKTQKNIAPPAVTFAFLIGCGVLQLKPKEILSFLPVSILFNVLAITFFFGFAIENGTLAAVTGKILYAMRNHPKWMMPAMCLISFLIAMSGAGIATAAFMAPIAFSLSKKIEAHPVAAYTAVAAGTVAGSNFMYSGGGIVVLNLVKESPYTELAFPVTVFSFLLTTAICLIFFFVIYMVFRNGKCVGQVYERPEVLSSVQKKTLALLLIVVLVIIIPNFVGELTGNSAIRSLAGRLDVGFVMMIGGCVASVLNLADDRQVLRFQVPWTTLVMLGGVSMLIGVGKEAGLVELLAGLISGHLPKILIAPVLSLSAGLMSVFSSAISVVLPTLYPLVPELTKDTGVSAQLMYSVIFVSATITGISPLSTTGSMILGGCKSEKVRSRLFYQVIPLPFILLAVMVGLSIVFSAIHI
ncbi:SLC13 family permease [Hominifimenecus microfluidus]|uniref:SLC13 family permease n=1 Tax=Hominifimenecus microfluidus TaxID=2885348 RepID=UPI0032BF9E86